MLKISILTATYNREKLLPKLYQSLVQNSETYANFEWLIMDDGSTDGTNELVTKWTAEKKIDIHYYYQENAGKMAAINNLAKYVTGDIWIEMDSDDFRDYSIANTVPDGRYAKTGLRKPYIFPMGIKDGKLLIYIGTATEDVIFNYISGSGNAVLRPITAEERNAISSYSLSSGASFEIRIPAGEEDMIIPFFLNGSMTGATVRLDGDTDPSVSVTVVAGDTSGIGYAERSLRNGMDSAVFKDYHALEYGYIKVRGARDESTVRLSFSR